MKRISISILLLTLLIAIPNQLFPRFGMHVGFGHSWGWGGPRAYWGGPYYDSVYPFGGVTVVESRPKTQAEIDAEERQREQNALERKNREERKALEKQIRLLSRDIKDARKHNDDATAQMLEKQRENLRKVFERQLL